MKDNNTNEVPIQVLILIQNMLDKKENLHIRGNYRGRLDTIRKSINQAIDKYDNELNLANTVRKK